MKKQQTKTNATIAPGIDNDEELETKASQDEKQSGEYTEVTTLSLDEYDPSSN
ncbi:hypothetical protein OEV98_14370 [Caldibacillus lycopersici]|uniref:Uncharacterized protein n=1 Tax=Perspicuibacillus lycopersici TaxID=1325689 RepID=A0AAE3LNH8_9BACI|nr:hypothetical protein [Perspicuibacillus lycopersici]MCU9614725.1 hypothetical protein [Perspicuibacillus lycopersici]